MAPSEGLAVTKREYVITGIFSSREEAEAAAKTLRDAGFERAETKPAAGEGAVPVAGARWLDGLVAGAVVGLILGVALEATILALPGRGPFGTGGWLGGAVAGGIAGGVAGAVARQGLAQVAADRARRRLAQAAALTVRARDRFRRERARLVLLQAGAIETRAPAGEDATVFHSGFAQVVPELKERWLSRYGTTGARWEDQEPRYRYGWQMANRPDFEGRAWSDAEADVRLEWETRHAATPWAEAGDQVSDGWNSARQMPKPTR